MARVIASLTGGALFWAVVIAVILIALALSSMDEG